LYYEREWSTQLKKKNGVITISTRTRDVDSCQCPDPLSKACT